MTGEHGSETKQVLVRYLRAQREALLWKLEGLSEYDQRRPLDADGDECARVGQARGLHRSGIFRGVHGATVPRVAS